MKINQYEFLREGKPFEPTREEIIQFAEHQLAEKDKEIEELRDRFLVELEITARGATEIYNNNIRHQICEEIRKKAFRDCIGLKEWGNFYHYVISPEILDQIEQGEKK